MHNFILDDPVTHFNLPEHYAILEHQRFHHWKYTLPPGQPSPLNLIRRLSFESHLPISNEIFKFDCPLACSRLDAIQDMVIQIGFIILGVQRRNATGETMDDGKLGYLETIFEAWVEYLSTLWDVMLTAKTEVSAGMVEDAAVWASVTEEVSLFLRDVGIKGVEWMSAELEVEAKMWTEAMLKKPGTLGLEFWRDRICDLLQGKVIDFYGPTS